MRGAPTRRGHIFEVVGGPQTTQLIEKFRPPGRPQCETWLLQRARSCILDFSSWKRLAGLSAPATIAVRASSSPDSFASETTMPSAHPSAEFAPQPLEEPIRAELFGVERLEQHAGSLAAAQHVMSELEKGRRLLPRVEDNGRVLREAYRAIAKAIREDRAITPAAEWLVDNFHIVDEQLREIRDDLPAGFYWQLPKLTEGPLAGYPRVYGIAWAFVAHTDSRFDPETLRRFVRAYQRIQPLTIGELWAVAITLRVEHQRQAAMNVTVRNVITSMRLMSALDWTEFFESVSLVDEVLRVGTTYAAMDFSTRDRYRHAIEELARGSGRSELDVAREAVLLATRTGLGAGRADDHHDARRDDPGYYLIADGRTALELAIGFRPPATRRVFRAYVASATAGYLGTIIVLSGLTLALPLLTVGASGTMPASLILLGLLAAVPASDLVIALLNRWVPVLLPPRVLPRLELRDGVPSSLRTMIVVPTLLTDRTEVAELIERLEVHYLANPDGEVRFALLSDWTDAPTESGPGDGETLAAAREGIGRLNSHYGDALEGGQRFLLFHRRRLWNESEQTWMGWERKRGKLHELNRLLRGATDTSFLSAGGAAPLAPPAVRDRITPPADTRRPQWAVNRLVGTMAHPLNGPRFDPGTGRVVEGYAVLQPRVTPPLPGSESSFFQRLSSGPSGIDPYAAAVSDVYQDLFGEGSYTGKGIYDVDAFEAALAGRAPENALLSHDLFEGLFARAGLVTDIELVERAPSHYEVAAARQHRWARGDWQLLPWIVGCGSHLPIPLIGRWKMMDNLRRTLSAPATFLTLVVGWTLPAASPVVWTAFVLTTIALPTLVPILTVVIPRRRGISKRSYTRAIGRDLGLAASQTAFVITMLAHQAWLMSDAIVRTLVRVYVTHCKLLE